MDNPFPAEGAKFPEAEKTRACQNHHQVLRLTTKQLSLFVTIRLTARAKQSLSIASALILIRQAEFLQPVHQRRFRRIAVPARVRDLDSLAHLLQGLLEHVRELEGHRLHLQGQRSVVVEEVRTLELEFDFV